MRQPFISAQQVRLCAGGRPTGRWPETGLEEITRPSPQSGPQAFAEVYQAPLASDAA
jgi:hypothetical protein